jgi:hypothetical protein
MARKKGNTTEFDKIISTTINNAVNKYMDKQKLKVQGSLAALEN